MLQCPCRATLYWSVQCRAEPCRCPGADAVELRLAGGSSPCAGRVEVKLQGRWGSVGDDDWDMEDAEVVCQQQGCGSAAGAYFARDRFGVGDGPISLFRVDCNGNESTFWDCEIRGWGPYNFSHDRDTAVVCQGSCRTGGECGTSCMSLDTGPALLPQDFPGWLVAMEPVPGSWRYGRAGPGWVCARIRWT